MVSKHNAEYTTLRKIINLQCGFDLPITQPSGGEFKVLKDVNGKYFYSSNTLSVECPTGLAQTPEKRTVTISFTPPRTREDDSPFDCNLIDTYQLVIDGFFPTELSVRAVACEGDLCSGDSEIITTNIQEP